MKSIKKLIKKVLVSGLTGSLLLNSISFYSFANMNNLDNILVSNLETKNTSEIYYELLMGIMGIGVSFGLSLPKDNAEYWDYIKSLKNHLYIIDDNYLDILDKSAKEWKVNNDKKPDNEKKPFKAPITPSVYDKLKKLYSNVGEDISANYNYTGDLINGIPVGYPDNYTNPEVNKTYDISKYSVTFSFIPKNQVYTTIKLYKGEDNILNYSIYTEYGQIDSYIPSWDVNDGTYTISVRPGYNKSIELIRRTSLGWTTTSPKHYSNDKTLDYIYLDASNPSIKPSIDYNPVNPSIEEDFIIVLNGLPNIDIPSIETVPGYNSDVNINSPFDVIIPEGCIESSTVEKAEESKDVTDIESARDLVNKLPEGELKAQLHTRLDAIIPNVSLTPLNGTSSVDTYIKTENILSMTLDTNTITFEDFSGIEDMDKPNAINITVSSSLPYQLNAYLPVEIQNADKTKTMDKTILNIKENRELEYKSFTNLNEKVVLKDNCIAGDDIIHGVDLKLKGGIAHEKDVYKATIKLEVEQK